MKKTLLFGTIGVITAPMVSVISCSDVPQQELPSQAEIDKKGGPEYGDGIRITYWPDIDAALALGAQVDSAPKEKGIGKFATWFPKGGRYENYLKTLKETKPIWDFSTLDEEYWRNINNGNPVGIVHEKWLTTQQKEFLSEDPNIVPIPFDNNEGVPHEKYHWVTENDEEVLFQNKTSENYVEMNNLWQIRDMGKILEKSAKSLDKVYKTTKYTTKAKQVIGLTDDHWKYFRNLQETERNIKPFTQEQLNNRDLDLSSAKIDDAKTGSSKNDETILLMGIKKGAANTNIEDVLRFTSVSSHKELYTKTHFRMPTLTDFQSDYLKRGSNIDSNGIVNIGGISNNSINFPQPKKVPLPHEFWADWYGKIDKIVFYMSYSELNNGTDYYEQFNNATELNSIGVILKKLLNVDKLTSNKIMFEQDLLASGARSMAYKMPIGQNSFIDNMTKSFYGTDKKFEWETKF